MEFQNEPGGIEVVIRRFRGATFKVAPHFCLVRARVHFTQRGSAGGVTTHRAEVAVRYSADLCWFGGGSFT